MTYTRHLIAAAGLAAIVASLSVSANSAGYYRWTDEQGQTHYTQSPPQGRPAEFIRTSTGSRSTESAAPADTGSAPDGANNEAAESQSEQLEGLPAPDPALCRQAHEVLESLDGYARIRAKQPDGSYKVLDEADKAEQRQLATEAIELYCE